MPLVPGLKAAILILAACATLASGYWLRGLRADREVAQLGRQHAAETARRVSAALKASEEARLEEARRAFEMERIARDANAQAAQARRDAAAADDAARRLRDHTARLASQCAIRAGSIGPATTVGSAPAVDPGLVLAELRDRADAIAGELAASLDQSRTAGLACERAYDSLTSR